MEYQKKTNKLFEEWKKLSEENGLYGFCEDGLMYRGEIVTSNEDGKCYWSRNPGNEEELWENAPKRVMFLNKDVNSNEGKDIREWLFRQNEKYITQKIYKNISLWLYGLLNVDDKGKTPTFEDAYNPDVFSPFMDKTPIAYVNCKKESGGGSISQEVLWGYIYKYKDFIIRQIEILNPDIIVCGDGTDSLKDFVIENIYPSAKKINWWMYYDEINNKLIIASYHPSCYSLSYEKLYNEMMNSYESFLSGHPDFMNSCRR